MTHKENVYRLWSYLKKAALHTESNLSSLMSPVPFSIFTNGNGALTALNFLQLKAFRALRQKRESLGASKTQAAHKTLTTQQNNRKKTHLTAKTVLCLIMPLVYLSKAAACLDINGR